MNDGADIWPEKVRCSSELKPRLRTVRVATSDEQVSMRRNLASVLACLHGDTLNHTPVPLQREHTLCDYVDDCLVDEGDKVLLHARQKSIICHSIDIQESSRVKVVS